MSLSDVLTGMVNALRGMDGLVRAYDNPPEALTEFPCLVVYAWRGEQKVISYGFGQSFHTIRVEVYLSRTLLPQAHTAALPWPKRIMDAMAADQRLGGACDAIVWPVSYQVGALSYGSETFLGVRYEIRVKVDEEVTTG